MPEWSVQSWRRLPREWPGDNLDMDNFGTGTFRHLFECYFLVGPGWLLLFPGGLWMVAVISWWALDGSSYFLVGSGWFLLFPGGLWMVADISWWALDGSHNHCITDTVTRPKREREREKERESERERERDSNRLGE